MAEYVTSRGEGRRSSGDTSGSVPSTPGGAGVGRDSGGASSTGDGNGGGSNSRTVAASGVSTARREPIPTIPGQPATSGREPVSTGGVRPSTSGSDRRGSGRDGGGEQRSTGGGTEEKGQHVPLVRGLEEKPDAEEEPERPLFVGIPRATKAEKAQSTPPKPKGKAADVDSETVALLVSASFEVPAFIFQRLTPLQGGHPWWSKTPDQVHDKVAVPLTEIINGMSPKVKKLIKENTNYAALLAGLVAVLDEPIQMEIEVHRQYKEAKLALLRGLPQTVPANGASVRRAPQRPPSGLEGARSYWAEESEEGVVGDTPI